MTTVYYNENDLKAAAWLERLMIEGHIPHGHIDTRSIEDVQPKDLMGYRQCHFFAGIGGWAYALHLAGWGDRPVWTGSCPCQPFSAAGKGKGVDDERHLFPAWRWLIKQCRPTTIFGEQVASKSGRTWLSAVQIHIEALGFEFGAADLGAACVGAPHIRQRLWFVAERMDDSACVGRRVNETTEAAKKRQGERRQTVVASGNGCGRIPDTNSDIDRGGYSGEKGQAHEKSNGRWENPSRNVSRFLHDPGDDDLGRMENANSEIQRCGKTDPRSINPTERGTDSGNNRNSSRLDNDWQDIYWVPCTDGKARPLKPGLKPLAIRIPSRVVRVRGYGNAIVPQVAYQFIKAYMETQQRGEHGH